MATTDPWADDEDFQRQDTVSTGPDPWAHYNTQIQGAYKQYLGRDAGPDDLRLHHGNNPAGWNDDAFLNQAIQNIQNSDEAKAYANRNTGEPPPPPPPPGPGGPTGPAPTGTGAVSSINVPSATLPGEISGLFNRQPAQTPVQSAYQDALLKFMGRSQETPSLSDPTLAPQVEVYRAQEQRNQERQRRTAAERAAASGQSESGYLDRAINQGVQEQGFNTARFNAELLGGEMSKRRDELQAALQLARATGDAEAARELQTRLAQASAMMQQQGLNLQGQLGGGDLSLRLLQSLMGNDQFYDQLGINTAMGMEDRNQRALQIILGAM